MSVAQGLTRRVVGAYEAGTLSNWARRRRWSELATTFPGIAEMTVLDLGGDARAWRNAPVQPAHVILVNVVEQQIDEPWMSAIVGDVCDPALNLPLADLTYSNSVIEHVGGHWRRQQLAETTCAAPRFWVQTPYRYFPIEPHFLIPFAQHLPHAAQSALLTRWPLGNYSAVRDPARAVRSVLNIELLSKAEMRFYFPEAELREERVLGLVKSLIAVKAG